MNIKILFQSIFSCLLLCIFFSSCQKADLNEIKDDTLLSKTDMISNPNLDIRIPSSFNGLFISKSQYSKDLTDTELILATVPNAVAGDMIWIHIVNGPSATSYQPRSWVHTDKGDDATKYKIPDETEHMTTGPDATKQGPVGWAHVTTGPGATTYAPSNTVHIAEGPDKTKYSVQGYVHITEGANKTYYKKYTPPVTGGGIFELNENFNSF